MVHFKDAIYIYRAPRVALPCLYISPECRGNLLVAIWNLTTRCHKILHAGLLCNLGILVTLFLSRCHQPFYIHTFRFLIMKSCFNCEKKHMHTSRQISFNHFILSRHSLEFVHRLLSDSLHSLSYSLLNTLSPSLCLGWSASLQLGSYPDIHTDAAIDRQFSNIPHSYRTSHGPWTQPALPHPMGGWEHHRKGEHWCVRRRHTETLCQHIWGGSRTYIFS